MKKLLTLLACLSLLLIASGASAILIDFEDVPEDYWYFGGNQNIGDFYEGLFFGPTVTILENVVYGYNDIDYPPCSGNQVAFTADNEHIQVDFESGATYASICYTSYYDFYLEAYDAGGVMIDSDSGPPNTGTSDYLEVAGDYIAYVVMHDSGNYYVVDDFEYLPASTPTEESSWSVVKSMY